MTRRGVAAALAATACAWLLAPATAAAHGLAVREDLPIPPWLFVWGAALVLIVSFVGLATLWPQPRLQDQTWTPLHGYLSRFAVSRPLRLAAPALSAFLLFLTVWSGLRGIENSGENFAPTFVYIVFWLGLVPVSVIAGDVFRALNPWAAIAKPVGAVARLVAGEPLPAPLRYPQRLGRWPAVLGILAFGWLELATNGGDAPQTVATASLVYSAVTFTGMALFGIDAWLDRGEAFSVYFNLISRIAPLEIRDGKLGRRRWLSGLTGWPQTPGGTTFICSLIGIVTFDGFSNGAIWNGWIPSLQSFYGDFGLNAAQALEPTFGTGLLVAVALVICFYRLGILGARSVGGDMSAGALASSFAHTLAPIAVAYAAAHYASFLLLQGQAIIPLLSDPLGRGSDLFGTASVKPDLTAIGASTFWYLQVALIVAGHVAALMLAHDRALVLYEDARQATRSQYWMLAIMIAFTCLALWLLSSATG